MWHLIILLIGLLAIAFFWLSVTAVCVWRERRELQRKLKIQDGSIKEVLVCGKKRYRGNGLSVSNEAPAFLKLSSF